MAIGCQPLNPHLNNAEFSFTKHFFELKCCAAVELFNIYERILLKSSAMNKTSACMTMLIFMKWEGESATMRGGKDIKNLSGYLWRIFFRLFLWMKSEFFMPYCRRIVLLLLWFALNFPLAVIQFSGLVAQDKKL